MIPQRWTTTGAVFVKGMKRPHQPQKVEVVEASAFDAVVQERDEAKSLVTTLRERLFVTNEANVANKARVRELEAAIDVMNGCRLDDDHFTDLITAERAEQSNRHGRTPREAGFDEGVRKGYAAGEDRIVLRLRELASDRHGWQPDAIRYVLSVIEGGSDDPA